MASDTEEDVKITYQHSGTRPPMFVAGTFTDPAWVPVELEHEIVTSSHQASDKEATDYLFSRSFKVKPGTYQYKYRVGCDGDWWGCDESKPTTADESGNRNNLLVVKAAAENELPLKDRLEHRLTLHVVDHSDLPTLRYDEEPHWDSPVSEHDYPVRELGPLLSHEKSPAEQAADELHRGRRDSDSPANSKGSKKGSPRQPRIPEGDDLDDLNLVPFPTTRQGIIGELANIMNRLPEDEGTTSDEDWDTSESAMQDVSGPPPVLDKPNSSSPVLEPITEAHEEEEKSAAEDPKNVKAMPLGLDGSSEAHDGLGRVPTDQKDGSAEPPGQFTAHSADAEQNDADNESHHTSDFFSSDEEVDVSSAVNNEDRCRDITPEEDSAQIQLHSDGAVETSSQPGIGSHGNFFQAFLRIFIVEWLGGFFASLCGRRNPK